MLPAQIVAITVVLTQRIIAGGRLVMRNFSVFPRAMSVLVCNGVIDVKEMERSGLSQERLFAELGCNAILHLGEVERLYIDANGAFTLIKAKRNIGWIVCNSHPGSAVFG